MTDDEIVLTIPDDAVQLLNQSPFYKEEIEVKNKLPKRRNQGFYHIDEERIDIEISTFYQRICIYFSKTVGEKEYGGYYKLYYSYEYGTLYSLWLEFINPLRIPMLDLPDDKLEIFRIEQNETTKKEFPFPYYSRIVIEGVTFTELFKRLPSRYSIPKSTLIIPAIPYQLKKFEIKDCDWIKNLNYEELDADEKRFLTKNEHIIQIDLY